MRRVLFVLGFFAFVFCSKAQSVKSILTDAGTVASINKALALIYNFQFEEAYPIIKSLKSDYPNHPVHSFLMASALYWQLIPISQQHPKFLTYKQYLDKAIESANPLLEYKQTQAEASFFLLSAHASMALVHVKSKQTLEAVGSARKAYQFMKTGFELKSTIPDFYFSTGLYDYYAELYPEMHPVFKPFMFFFEDGDKQKGIQELEVSATKGTFTKTESAYFLGYVHLKYELDAVKSSKWFSWLVDQYPKNLYYKARYAESLMMEQKFVLALPLIEELEKDNREIFKLISLIIRGTYQEKHLKDYALAKITYQKSLNVGLAFPKPTPEFLGYTYMGLSRIAFVEKNYKLCLQYAKKVLDISEYRGMNLEAEAMIKRCKTHVR